MKSDLESIRLLVLECSPRKNGNTSLVMDRLIGAASEVVDQSDSMKLVVERISIPSLKISGCTACMACRKDGECVIRDDMDLLYKRFDEVDIIVIASPTFYNSIPAQAKSMVDRCQIYWSRRFALGIKKTAKAKKAFLVSTAGSSAENARLGVSLTMELFYTSIDAKLICHSHIGGLDAFEQDYLKEKVFFKNTCNGSNRKVIRTELDKEAESLLKSLVKAECEFVTSVLSVAIDSED